MPTEEEKQRVKEIAARELIVAYGERLVEANITPAMLDGYTHVMGAVLAMPSGPVLVKVTLEFTSDAKAIESVMSRFSEGDG